MTNSMPSAYDPSTVEAGWYSRWLEAGLFRADPASPKPKYSIALPPPNVTGELHMGHALNGTVQDILARYHRMKGFEVLFQPGSDHAAIATQNAIERKLAAEGMTKEELGRAAFEELVEEWYAKVGGTIVSQYKELGVSLDLSRNRFTMDPGYVRSVHAAFVHFFDKGWLYRGPRIVNWCPRCLSAISDLEVAWEEHEDTLYSIRYPVEGGGEVVVATVRPETMLFDAGVAVSPDDERYRDVVGRNTILPLVGRRLPIVADQGVEKEFGTGALKVTPGHDPLDYEIGRRHGLEIFNGMHSDGRLNVPDLPQYDGLEGVTAREKVVADLRAGGYLVGTEPYRHQVGHCDRCGFILEPMISEQWFLTMKEMAAAAAAASEAGKVRWHPERYERTYLDWLRGLRDWCVSRQLWLGHRIPIYTCPDGHVFAAVGTPEVCRECGAGPLEQDPDVLDTWFSSALWPLASLGWPDDTPELRAFYPTDLNCTAREIINLWVSRMIMTGLEFMGEVPFRDVAIHCVVQTADGQRMSKSKGTGIDPREMIRLYGADALRAWSASIAMLTQDVRFDQSRIEGFRRFANKLWNATRLVLGPGTQAQGEDEARLVPTMLTDRWILSELQSTVQEVTAGIDSLGFLGAVNRLYAFAWNQFCDWYLEAAKARLRGGDPAARAVAVQVLDKLFRLLHPFMPFVTEELWSRLPGKRDFLIRTAWPAVDNGLLDTSAVGCFERVMALVEEVRGARQAAGAPPSGGKLCLAEEMDAEGRELVSALAGVELVETLEPPGQPLFQFEAMVEFPVAQANGSGRREAELKRLRADLARVDGKLANPDFRAKAPAAVVAKEEAKSVELRAALERLGY